MFNYVSERYIDSMISGTFYAALLIGLVIAACLRSLLMGFVSLIPNILPVVATFPYT